MSIECVLLLEIAFSYSRMPLARARCDHGGLFQRCAAQNTIDPVVCACWVVNLILSCCVGGGVTVVQLEGRQIRQPRSPPPGGQK